uniref:Peptidase S1 domain-containing protein n=1 Tax=Panthera leo TaxID=9689 RepID=A0A8C8WI51_PANLE
MASRGGFLGLQLCLLLLQPLLGGADGQQAASRRRGGLGCWRGGVVVRVRGHPGAPSSPFSLVSQPGCGHRSMRIVGGVAAPRRKWPWHVSLQINNKHIRGGSLIASRWVLTAAHCVTGHEDYTVRLGDKSLYPNSKTTLVVPVEDIVCHRFFDDTTLRHDIALALLAFAVNYSSYMQPVCLPEKSFQAETGTECWVTGWGQPEEAPMPVLLQETEQHILHHKKCNWILQTQLGTFRSMVRKGMICAYRAEKKGICKGDSGGPLVCEFNETWVQVGIVSWGIGCGRRNFPAVYTEVSFYRDWVTDHLSQACSWDSLAGSCSLDSVCLPGAS